MLTQLQHQARARGIAASDLAAILGKNPWKGPTDVWRCKVDGYVDDVGDQVRILGKNPWKGPTDVWRCKVDGYVDDVGDQVRVDWGNRLEDPIRSWYAHTLGVDVTVPGTLWHPTDQLAAATPDGIVYARQAANAQNGLEIKTHTISLRHLYGEPGTDEVPIWELLQCVWCMYVTMLPYWHLVAFIDGLPTLYVIERDRELEELCVEAAHGFWARYVVPRIPPPADGTDSYTAALLRQFPTHLGDVLAAAGPAELAAIRELRNVRNQLTDLEHREAVLEQQLKAVIGANAGLAWAEGKRTDKITWKRSRDSSATDWESVALERGAQADLLQSGARAVLERALAAGAIAPDVALALAASLGLADAPNTRAVIARHTKLVPGSRRFCVPRAWSRERPPTD